MTYYVYIDGGEGGCDYTLNCNAILEQLDAATLRDAIKEVRERHLGNPHEDEGYGCGEGHVRAATILNVTAAHEVDVGSWVAERRHEKNIADGVAKQEREREEYERLRAKFDHKQVP